MKLEQIKSNAELMKSKGLEKEIVETAKKTYQETLEKVRGYRGVKTHVYDESIISETLSLFGGSVKGLKILDLGCGTSPFGRGDYNPVLSTAFASLGANVTGVDLSNDSEEIRKKVFEKYGFSYMSHNFALWGFDKYIDEKDKERASNNDLIIMHSLLHNGLMIEDAGYGIYYRLDEEWSQYNRIIFNLNSLNKSSISLLQIPFPKHFPHEMQEIKEKNLNEEKMEKELNNYVVNKFKSSFGEPLFGKEFPGNHVFV